jgi:ribosomal-protein-alanine N-acetyltransferase
MIVIETASLILRHLTWEDIDDLAAIFADPVVMKFYPSTRTYEEAHKYLEGIFSLYEKYGFNLWATIHKAENKFIGRCGLIPQLVDGQQEV